MSVPKSGDPCWVALYIITVVVYGVTLAANYVIGTGGNTLFGLNFSSTGDVSDKFYLDITPAGWTFLIWAIIYTWQAAWMIYVGTLMCRKSENGSLYYSPPFFSSVVFVAYILNLCSNITWIFVWGLEYAQFALVFIALIPFFLYICLIISFYRLRKYGQQLINQGSKKDVILSIVLVQNGIGCYATWVSIATLLNFAMVLHYYAGVDLVLSGTIALAIVLAEAVLWFVLENFVFEKACRYFFAPYCVLIWALAGSMDKNWSNGAQNSIFSAVLITIAGIMLITKIVLVIVRSRKEAIFEWQGEEKKPLPMV